jgi:uncharacterized protein YjbI with pentapeptide repeats
MTRALWFLRQPKDLPQVWEVPTFKSEESGWRRPRININGSFLPGVKFAGKHLEGISFDDGAAQGSHFEEAHMQGIRMRQTHLEYADFQEADLTGADLLYAFASNASFLSAKLPRARLEHARLDDAKLSWADLEGANLNEAKLDGADLQRAKLTNADLSGASLVKVNLEKTTLYKATVEMKQYNGELLRADFSGANWWEAEFWTENTEPGIDESLIRWLEQHFPTSPENMQRLNNWRDDPKRARQVELDHLLDKYRSRVPSPDSQGAVPSGAAPPEQIAVGRKRPEA